MTVALTIGLSAALLYVGLRWMSSRAEVVELRQQVASLKRQLRYHGRPG